MFPPVPPQDPDPNYRGGEPEPERDRDRDRYRDDRPPRDRDYGDAPDYLDRIRKKPAGDDELTGGDWLLCILCSGIGCIVGIVYLIQGQPKGGKMLGISLLFIVLWNLFGFVLGLGSGGGMR